MKLDELNKGDKVVAFPHGIGRFIEISTEGFAVIKFPDENALCEIRKCYKIDGDECGYKKFPISCWPIDEAPKWVWEALGVEKPKKMVKKEFVRYCVLEGDSGKIFFTAVNEDYAKTWLKSAPHNNFVIAKAVFTYEVEE